MYWDEYDETPVNHRMDGKTKHPFNIVCRFCGSNSVSVYAHEYRDLCIKCNSCGKAVCCGAYHTDKGDYSDCIIN